MKRISILQLLTCLTLCVVPCVLEWNTISVRALIYYIITGAILALFYLLPQITRVRKMIVAGRLVMLIVFIVFDRYWYSERDGACHNTMRGCGNDVSEMLLAFAWIVATWAFLCLLYEMLVWLFSVMGISRRSAEQSDRTRFHSDAAD